MTDPRTPDAGRQTVAERYGTPSAGGRRALQIVIAVLVLVCLSWLGWAAWTHANQQVDGELTSFDVVSAHEVAVVIDVRRGSGEAVECTLQAKAADFAVVGEEVVVIPAGDEGTVTQELTLRTDREATTATVKDCRTAP
ncbi:MAG: DUF4307 domain-containing protein [Nocardioidaceae bacterium]|nr:DUF4307 domain-containing protein [Nocardioidaceae bacterium]